MRRKKTKNSKLERNAVSAGFTEVTSDTQSEKPEKPVLSRGISGTITKKLKFKSKKLVKVKHTEKMRGEVSCPVLSQKTTHFDDGEGTSNDCDEMDHKLMPAMGRSLSAVDGHKGSFNNDIAHLIDTYADDLNDVHKSSEEKSDQKVKASSVLLNLHVAHKSSSNEHSAEVVNDAERPGSGEISPPEGEILKQPSEDDHESLVSIRFDDPQKAEIDALLKHDASMDDSVNAKVETSKSPSPVHCDPTCAVDLSGTHSASFSEAEASSKSYSLDEVFLAQQQAIKTTSTKEQLVLVQDRLNLNKFFTKNINGETYEQQGRWFFKIDLPPPRPYQDTPKIYAHGKYPAVSGTFIDLEAQYQEGAEIFT